MERRSVCDPMRYRFMLNGDQISGDEDYNMKILFIFLLINALFFFQKMLICFSSPSPLITILGHRLPEGL